MVHERGLVSLTADWTFNDSALSLAHAVATFQDGRSFEEAGNATPSPSSIVSDHRGPKGTHHTK